MGDKKRYALGDAIKNSYKTEPLKIDLAETVADKAFNGPKKPSAVLDSGLYVFFAVLIVASIIYCLIFFKEFFLSPSFLFLIPIVAYFGLAAKEFMTMSKKISGATA